MVDTTDAALGAPHDLRCEYQTNPLGIDQSRPRLFWKLGDTRRGAMQSAYQVRVAGSAEDLARGVNLLWDSGKVDSDRCTHVAYEGAPLKSRQRVWWTVRTWSADGQVSPFAEPAWWEMGLLDRGDWKAQWIGSDMVGSPRASVPVPFLRKTFSLDRPIASARLYITALGLYEAYLNGQRVGQDIFTPGWTDYSRRVQYQVYDVTSMLSAGENVMGALLGDGWYCGNVEARGRQTWGDRPKLMGQLIVEFADGSSQTIVTDTSWRFAFGPLVESDLLMGENYDARRQMPGWDRPGFDDSAWRPAVRFDDPGIALVCSPGPRVRRIGEIAPVSLTPYPHWRSPIHIFDMGQNMVGRVRLRLKGIPGQTVRIRYAEMLKPDGHIYTENLRSARATDYYTFATDQVEEYEPTFTFHGFRYVELYYYTGEVKQDAITGVVLHSDTPPTGRFECSNPMLNQLQHNIVWGQKGNFLEVPTDCPQRDERLGWTGDAQVFIRTACFNMDVAGFFTKWLRDVEDAQGPKGEIPSFVPHPGPNDGGPGWADAAIICPWTIYLCYGDTRILSERYEMMQRFMTFLQETSKDCIRAYEGYPNQGYGDWLSINAETPKDLIGTAFYAHSAQLMSRIAQILGKQSDAQRYEALYQQVRSAFQRRFVTPDGLVVSGTQTAYVLALQFDLLPEQVRQTAVEALVRDIQQRGNHLSTGFLGTPYLCDVLTRYGRLDVAYTLLNQDTFPSWLYPVKCGATTIWERWDGWRHDKGFQDPGMNSFNHYAYGAIGAWMYRTIAGIDIDPQTPGHRHVIIHPRPGGGITWARASLQSLYGCIRSDWRIVGEALELRVTIPPNAWATLILPTGKLEQVRTNDLKYHLSNAPGVEQVQCDGKTVTCRVGAGSHRLVMPYEG